MPLSFFAPNLGHATTKVPEEVANEFRNMVKALHAAGVEVVLDAVYNHTIEGGENGPACNFRGIDNSTYYLLQEDRRRYRNDTMTWNNSCLVEELGRRLPSSAVSYRKQLDDLDPAGRVGNATILLTAFSIRRRPTNPRS
jgi:glycogen operon protein